MSRRRQIYEGKAKILYEGPEPGTLIQYFKDDATAFNAQKKGMIQGKGVINNRISEYVFTRLNHIGVPNHFIRRLNMREQLVRQVEIVPIEVVVRNVAAGSLSAVEAARCRTFAGSCKPRPLISASLRAASCCVPIRILYSRSVAPIFWWTSVTSPGGNEVHRCTASSRPKKLRIFSPAIMIAMPRPMKPSTATGWRNVSARLPSLEGPIRIEGADITLYRQTYLHITTPTTPDSEEGLWPDGLVPDVDETVREQRRAFPMDVPATEARALWVDVHVPLNAPPGEYRGTVEVTGEGHATQDHSSQHRQIQFGFHRGTASHFGPREASLKPRPTARFSGTIPFRRGAARAFHPRGRGSR